MWHNKSMQTRKTKSTAVNIMSYKPAIAGAVVLLLTGILARLILPVPAEFGPQPLLSVGDLFWSVVIGFSVSYYLIWYFDRLPTKSPILKSVILSGLALVIITGFDTLFHLSEAPSFFCLCIAYDAVSFVVTGVVIGFVYAKLYGRESPFIAGGWVASHPVAKRSRWYLYLAVAVAIAALVIFSMYQASLEPASFSATGIHFVTNNGTVQVVASITNPSQPSIIQVNAAIDGLDAGVCGYGFNTNSITLCRFSIIPLLSCAQVPETQNHTLTLSAYFSNTRMVTNDYLVTSAQLGCS